MLKTYFEFIETYSGLIYLVTRSIMAAFAILRAFQDFKLIQEGIRPNHFNNGLHTFLVVGVLMLFNPVQGLFYDMVSYFLIYWVLFDYFLNRFRELPYYYTGVKEEPDSNDNALMDQFLNWIGEKAGFIIKIVLLIVFNLLAGL